MDQLTEMRNDPDIFVYDRGRYKNIYEKGETLDYEQYIYHH